VSPGSPLRRTFHRNSCARPAGPYLSATLFEVGRLVGGTAAFSRPAVRRTARATKIS